LSLFGFLRTTLTSDVCGVFFRPLVLLHCVTSHDLIVIDIVLMKLVGYKVSMIRVDLRLLVLVLPPIIPTPFPSNPE
jgi:hypothetical protein